MRAIIVGAGDTGRHLTEAFVRENHDVVLIEQRADLLEPLQGKVDAQLVQANGASPEVLRDHRAAEAQLVVAVTDSDETNVVTALVARHLGAERTVARVRSEDYLQESEPFAQDVLGIDVLIHPERAAAEEIARAVTVAGAASVRDFCDGDLSVAEVVLSDDAPVLGSRLCDAGAAGRHVLGAARDEEAIPPRADDELRAGDRVLIGAPPDDITDAVQALAGEPPRVDDVMVIGAGPIGVAVARRLTAADVHVTVVERDEGRAHRAAEELPDADVLRSSVVGGDDLEDLGAGRADALIACTDDDQTNILAAFTGRRLGCRLTIPVVHGRELSPLLDALDLRSAILPRLIAASSILSLVRGTHVLRTLEMAQKPSLVEMQVDDRAAVCGRRVGEAALPDGVFVAAIVRDGGVLEPGDDERLEHGDRVVLFLAGVALDGVIAAFGG